MKDSELWAPEKESDASAVTGVSVQQCKDGSHALSPSGVRQRVRRYDNLYLCIVLATSGVDTL